MQPKKQGKTQLAWKQGRLGTTISQFCTGYFGEKLPSPRCHSPWGPDALVCTYEQEVNMSCFFQVADWPQHMLECKLISQDRSVIDTLALRWLTRLALRVLSRRRKDNGVPTEEYLEGWPMAVPRRTLDDYLSDQFDIDIGLTLEQIVAIEGDLWEFLGNHLLREKCNVDEQLCDTLMSKLCNRYGFVQNPYLYGGGIGAALYLQWSQFQVVCGMERPDFEIYYDSDVSVSVIQSLKHNPSQFETLLTESNRHLTYTELHQRTMCIFPDARLLYSPCSFCTDEVRAQLAIYGIWKECDKCEKPLVVIPTPQELFSYFTAGSIGSTEAQCLICKKMVPISEGKKRQILEYHFLSTMAKWERVLPDDSAERSMEMSSKLRRIWDLRSVLHWSNITVCYAASEIPCHEQMLLTSEGSGQMMSAEELETMITEFAERYEQFGWRSTVLSSMYEILAGCYALVGKMSKSRKALRKCRGELLKLIVSTHKAFDCFREALTR